MKNADYFSNYVTEDFTTYINRKRKNNCHGNHIEMQAMAEMYNRPVEVYQYGTGNTTISDMPKAPFTPERFIYLFFACSSKTLNKTIPIYFNGLCSHMSALSPEAKLLSLKVNSFWQITSFWPHDINRNT